MKSAHRDVLSDRWDALHIGQILFTPSKRKSFTVASLTPEKIIIKTEGENTPIPVTRAALLAAVAYLRDHGHTAANKIEIRSNKVYALAGPLCRAIRDANGVSRMVSTYALPILAQMGVVGIDHSVPNRAWLI